MVVDGSVPIRDLNRAMDWHLPDEEATTVAGLVIHEARSIPDRGQSFTFHGFRFRVLRRERNRITALRIVPVPREAEGEERSRSGRDGVLTPAFDVMMMPLRFDRPPQGMSRVRTELLQLRKQFCCPARSAQGKTGLPIHLPAVSPGACALIASACTVPASSAASAALIMRWRSIRLFPSNAGDTI